MESPADSGGSNPERPPHAEASASGKGFFGKLEALAVVKVLGLGGLLIALPGWLIHQYGEPAAQSVWEKIVRPQVDDFIVQEMRRSSNVHDFMVTEINSYLAGDIASQQKRNEIGDKLKTLAQDVDKIDTMASSLFGSVDSVYLIANDYNFTQSKDDKGVLTIATPPAADPIRLLIYANPADHCVWVHVKAKGDMQRYKGRQRFNFDLTLNDVKKLTDDLPVFQGEISKHISRRQGTGGGGSLDNDDIETESVISSLDNIQKIEITPEFHYLGPIQISGSSDNIPLVQPISLRIEGFVLVMRRQRSENKTLNCSQTYNTAGATNANE